MNEDIKEMSSINKSIKKLEKIYNWVQEDPQRHYILYSSPNRENIYLVPVDARNERGGPEIIPVSDIEKLLKKK